LSLSIADLLSFVFPASLPVEHHYITGMTVVSFPHM
jgi:hypothetical protein